MIDKKYLQDAEKLINTAEKNYNKDIYRVSNHPYQNYKQDINTILPSFKFIQDGWNNLISGLGGKQSKNIYTSYKTNFCITDSILHSLFLSNGMAKKISKVVADDATKNGITIKNDTENLLLDKFELLNGLSEINQADLYRRHYGGSIIIMGINDGGKLFEEVNINNIKSVDWLKTYSRTDCYFNNKHFSDDINSKNYGKPEFYTVIPKYASAFNVHVSRVLEFKGIQMPTQLDTGYRYYWGASVIEGLWETLKKIGASLENVDQLLYEVTISIYKIKGLAQLICEGNWEAIKKAIDTVDMSKSTINAIIQDAEDDYKRDSITFAGIKEMVSIFFDWLSGEAEIPATRLFGKQQGGLNNEGDLELTTYYDMIKAHQKNDLQKQTQILIDYINLSKEIKTVKNPIVSYNNPYQLTQKEELELKKIQSEIDKNYIDNGILNVEEVRKSRFENGYSFDMKLLENELLEREMSLENNLEGEENE
jgi:phage-related protein (TIGR01555 family)